MFKNSTYNESQGSFLIKIHIYSDFLIREVQISLCKKDHSKNTHAVTNWKRENFISVKNKGDVGTDDSKSRTQIIKVSNMESSNFRPQTCYYLIMWIVASHHNLTLKYNILLWLNNDTQ